MRKKLVNKKDLFFYDLFKNEGHSLIEKSLDKIIDLHNRYKKSSVLSLKENIS